MIKSFLPILFLIIIVGFSVALFGLRSSETTNDIDVTTVLATTENGFKTFVLKLFGQSSAEPNNDVNVTTVQVSTEDVQINTENLKTVTLDVPSMNCISCPYAVRKNLTNIPGVADVKALLLTRTVVVLFDSTEVNIATFIKATTDIVYPSYLREG